MSSSRQFAEHCSSERGDDQQKHRLGGERVSRKRICFVVSHPIQYTVPLYQRLARRDDIAIKVFFTWHAGGKAIEDRGFGRAIAWDIPLTEGYEFEPVPNVAAAPGTDRLFGLRNPALLDRVMTWRRTSCMSPDGLVFTSAIVARVCIGAAYHAVFRRLPPVGR